MHTRQLGNTDLHITPIGVGAWAIAEIEAHLPAPARLES